MKTNFYSLFLIALFFIAQPVFSQSQSVSHGGIHFNIPSDWFFQTRSAPNGNGTIESGKHGEPNSFTINKVNYGLSVKEGLGLAKKMTAGNTFLKNADYSPYKEGTFNGYPSAETSFSLNFQGTTFKGKMLAFKNGNEEVYVIMYMGNEAYNNGEILKSILSSVKVDK